MKKMFQKL
ncbi:Protein of unknown function [Bacillus wiedmannii]|uniref:Uncharacterized protein n=2 Tax=Bacillus cereus group TaxID=86661 RepID=A0A1C4CKZ8_9BACI|nr:Protein of unknown function [Bacillus mycoides]SCC18627.1 Protein of unknown function [Bacillus mycoides]SCC19693.1 Protein of unknown function [Bacillus wiedmannii]SCL92442.1 Protein of unknown function [Bacillus wiedmannii]SCN07236.1 Protein of unknown function [Bacillus wiedmannii]